MDLRNTDAALIWHPYTHHSRAGHNRVIVRGSGALLEDDEGRSLIDVGGSWWVNLHGHANPHIAKRIARQASRLEHVIFAGFTHPPAVELAARLLPRLPGNQRRLFFSDNGSTAVEVALKMAIQYRVNRGEEPGEILAFEKAYHGDTFGAMSVGERGVFNEAFRSRLFDVQTTPPPLPGDEARALASLEQQLRAHDVRTFIFEPLLLAAGGMLMYTPGVLDEMLGMCKDFGVVTIADEVVTGFGRTGKWFASDHLSRRPDIICLAKGLTGGFLPCGATSCSERIYESFDSGGASSTFFHGHSYSGNPIACAAAQASLDILEQPECWRRIDELCRRFAEFRGQVERHPSAAAARNLGATMAITFGDSSGGYLGNHRDWLYGFFLDRGVLMRPLGNTIYLVPPYVIEPAQLDQVFAAIMDALDEIPA